MKRKLISIALCGVMLLAGSVTAFGAEISGAASGPIKLSLDQAIKQMQTEGIKAQTAEIKRQEDKAATEKYSETAKNLKRILEGNNESSSVLEQKINKLNQAYAQANMDKNYQADMNAIEKETVQLYYGVLQAQDGVKAAQDNLTVQNNLLENVQKKFSAGVAAKKEVMSQETSVVGAKSSLKTAEVKLAEAKMSLNLLLGYDLTQEVILTDTLKELEYPTVTLDQAIANAKANSMDVAYAQLYADIQKATLDSMKYTISTASSTYKKQQLGYDSALQSVKNAPIYLEMNVRNQYNALEEKRLAIEAARANCDFSKENVRLTQISYDAGIAILDDVQGAQLKAFNDDMMLAAAITDYDLAVYELGYTQGAGTERKDLP
ncbi:TolC family protein [Bacilliculturomica massiliensis]|uniref:TolC family protein n=1 Tax=Bacilliculturomica massiliensis TaxID=1917867 RepID=UPI0010307449|nr:TolC family protein [Bacilliculturomica massiliensis]